MNWLSNWWKHQNFEISMTWVNYYYLQVSIFLLWINIIYLSVWDTQNIWYHIYRILVSTKFDIIFHISRIVIKLWRVGGEAWEVGRQSFLKINASIWVHNCGLTWSEHTHTHTQTRAYFWHISLIQYGMLWTKWELILPRVFASIWAIVIWIDVLLCIMHRIWTIGFRSI